MTIVGRLQRLMMCGILVALAPAALAQGRFCIDRDTIAFGDRPVGTQTTVSVSVGNCGSGAYSFTDVSVHPSTAAGFSVVAGCATGRVLQPGESCTAAITFSPSIPGQQSGALWLRNTTSTPAQLVTFYGRGTTAAAGTASLAFSPSTLLFEATALGAVSPVVRLQLQNRGSTAITPTALVLNGPAAYDYNGEGDCAVGRVIPPGGSCHLDMVFSPQAVGTRIAQLNVDAPELATLAILRLSGTGLAATALPAASDIVEFHHASLDGYFLTADAAEIAFIDGGGLGRDWSRTGRVLRGWPAGPGVAGAADVCRFFGTPGRGPDSHFYTSDAGECAAVKADPFWTYEGVAFRVLPLGATGCAAGTTAVQRLMKPGGVVTGLRHRYVTAAADVDAMRALGWTLEGAVFCAPR